MKNTFKFLSLTEEGIEKANTVGDKFDALLTELEGLCPAGREFSLVVTNMQQASFWAKKSISLDSLNQKQAA